MISRILVEHYKGLTFLETFPKALTVISGANGTGKTSFIDAIQDVADGGHHSERIRHGAKKACIEIDTSDGIEIRKSITPKGYTLTVTGADGAEIKSPQTYVTKLFASGVGFDPLSFAAMKPKDRAAMLATLMPLTFRKEDLPKVFPAMPGSKNLNATRAEELLAEVPESEFDLAGIDALRKSTYDKRTRANTLSKDAVATAANLRKALPQGDEDVDWRARATELDQEERALNGDLMLLLAANQDDLRKQIEGIQAEAQRRIEEIRDEANRKIENSRQESRLEELQIRSDSAPAIEAKHAEAFTARKNADDQIRIQSLKDQIEREQKKARENSDVSEKCSALIEAIDESKRLALEKSPIEGVEVRDGDVFVGGIPFDEVNTQAQYFTCFQIAAMMGGGFMVCDRAEALDADNWEVFQAAAKSAGVQVVAARVVDGKPLTIETRAGELVNAE